MARVEERIHLGVGVWGIDNWPVQRHIDVGDRKYRTKTSEQIIEVVVAVRLCRVYGLRGSVIGGGRLATVQRAQRTRCDGTHEPRGYGHMLDNKGRTDEDTAACEPLDPTADIACAHTIWFVSRCWSSP